MHWKAYLPLWYRRRKSTEWVQQIRLRLAEGIELRDRAPNEDARRQITPFVFRLGLIVEEMEAQYAESGTIGNYRRDA